MKTTLKVFTSSSLFLLLAAVLFSLCFVSCASLQEDVMVSSGDAVILQEADNFEDRFWEFTAAALNEQVVSSKELDAFVSDAEKKITSHTEPVLASRLYALQGLVSLMNGKNKKASECYDKAKALHSGEEYVLLLASRLQNGFDAKINALNEYLLFDSDNPVFLLEKGILLGKTGDYTQSVASFDKAFLIFDYKDTNNKFRERFESYRNSMWKMHSSGIEANGNLNFSNTLGTERMAVLATERSGLLEDLLAGVKLSPKELVKKLDASGYLTASGDSDGSLCSSNDYYNGAVITRKLCARFLWNLYVRGKGNLKLLTANSQRYARQKNPKSPIEDLELSSSDFDAVLGVVEKDIMDLNGGILFEGDLPVSELDFVEALSRCENALR